MASSNQSEWDELKGIMDYRLSQCAKNSEELLHAAATKAVFFECGAFFKKKRGKAGLEEDDPNCETVDSKSSGRKKNAPLI